MQLKQHEIHKNKDTQNGDFCFIIIHPAMIVATKHRSVREISSFGAITQT